MFTRAEQFRYDEARKSHKVEPRPEPKGARPADASRHVSEHAARKAGYALEETAGRPTRRSTRGSSNRTKTDGQFRAKHRLGEARPPAQRPR